MTAPEEQPQQAPAPTVEEGRDSSTWLMYALVALAVVASAVMLLTDKVLWMKVAVLVALWAAFLGVVLTTRYRRQIAAERARTADLKRIYQLELKEEIAARREHELEVERHARQDAAAAYSAQLAALRTEIDGLRRYLTAVLDVDDAEMPVLRAQAHRVAEIDAATAPPAAPQDAPGEQALERDPVRLAEVDERAAAEAQHVREVAAAEAARQAAAQQAREEAEARARQQAEAQRRAEAAAADHAQRLERQRAAEAARVAEQQAAAAAAAQQAREEAEARARQEAQAERNTAAQAQHAAGSDSARADTDQLPAQPESAPGSPAVDEVLPRLGRSKHTVPVHRPVITPSPVEATDVDIADDDAYAGEHRAGTKSVQELLAEMKRRQRGH